MGKTTIEWTDATWNPVVGCTKVSRGCDLFHGPVPGLIPRGVMSTNEKPRAAMAIKFLEFHSTATAAQHDGIGLIGQSKGIIPLIFSAVTMMNGMMMTALGQLKIIRSIICSVPVDMMNLLSWLEWSAQLGFHDQPMFIDVSTGISHRMRRTPYEHITIRCDTSPATPLAVSYSAFQLIRARSAGF